ncbi:MAG: nucleotidyltransferase family protein [Terracidiphilus sp.]|jgi:NDP-sugar pyrophosphorylase family protein
MKAMILAAGLGTRLHPLTNDRPKALVEIAGRTLLEITLGRLRAFGISEVIVNVHHFADRVVEYLRAHDNFGMRIEISREHDLLDTGGGLMRASEFFLRDVRLREKSMRDEPFVLHNVDVLSAIDLGAMVKFHCEHDALATLAVQHRESARYLLFDGEGRLCGRRGAGDEAAEMARKSGQTEALAFTGIHVISPRIFSLMSEEREAQTFPIIPAYLRLAGAGEKIVGYRADDDYWRDVGTVESLEQAAEDVTRKVMEL